MATATPDSRHRQQRRGRRLVASLAATGAALLVAAVLTRCGLPALGAALAGITAMAVGFVAALFAIRTMLGRASGIAGVAGTVIDEAVRMRSTFVLLILLVGLVPTLPLLVDPAERLAYRVQFLIGWTLGGTGLILGLLTIFLACGSVCGDIDSGRTHMTLVKPLHRWEYLVGKWLGIILYDLLLVVLAGAGSYTLVRMLAVGPAADAADREALDRQVLAARRAVPPGPDRPEDYAAAIDAAIARMEADAADGPDAPGATGGGATATGLGQATARRRIRHEYERQWHTVTPDMETTFVFPGMGMAGRRGEAVQLQVEPRVTNVDVDLADVRFAIWINGRPWPLRDGVQAEVTLPSRVRHVFDLPAELVGQADDLRIRIANRNLIPPGETRPTAITFPPGDGMQALVRVAGFESNFVRCLLLMWAKIAMVAAVGVAAGAMFDLPAAIVATLVVALAAVGGEFFRDALGTSGVAGGTAWSQAADRMSFAAAALGGLRFYEAFRILLGFVTDGFLWILPSFSADAAVSRLATGIAIPLQSVISRLVLFGCVYPLIVGAIGWVVFDRRDLVRSSS
jgi:hypothetical protein